MCGCGPINWKPSEQLTFRAQSSDLEPPPLFLQAASALLGFAQHLEAIAQVAAHVAHDVSLELGERVLDLGEAVVHAQAEGMS